MIYRRLMMLAVFLVLIISGCGYTTRSMIADTYSTIYVSPVINKIDITNESYSGNKYRIYKPFVDTDIRQALVDKFLSDGNLRPVTEGSSDLILKSELVEFRKDALRYDKDDNVIEYRLNLVLNISLWDARENKLLWEENHFTGDTTYFTAQSDNEAIGKALSDLSRRVVERVVEEW